MRGAGAARSSPASGAAKGDRRVAVAAKSPEGLVEEAAAGASGRHVLGLLPTPEKLKAQSL